MKQQLQTIFANIRADIARDDMPAALRLLRTLLKNTPQLNDVLQQSGRFQNIRQQIRRGTVSREEATIEQNRIRYGVLELLADIEQEGLPPATLRELLTAVEQESTRPDLREEVEKAISIVNSKNVVANSTITAGGDVHIGDKTIHTESETSKRLRLFLFLFVPLLALGFAYLWYRAQPVTLTVAIQYQAANPDLVFTKGTITLYHGGKPDIKTIENEAIFTGIQRGEKVSLHFTAEGFVPMDTVLLSDETLLRLPIRRDNSLARVFGTVRDGQGKAVSGLTIRVQDLTTRTLPDGSFSLLLPPEKQRKKQRVEVIENGKVVWDYTQPIMADGGIEIQI